jgi:DNA ligase (NAD+)
MNIDGLGEKIINQLVNEGYVKSIPDLYKLEINSLLELERFGKKSAKNLLIEINESKNKNWHKQLYGLGIPHIGEANAKCLSKNFQSIEELNNIAKDAPENICNIYGFGNEIKDAIITWFNNSNNQTLIKELKAIGFSLKENVKSSYNSKQSNIFNGKVSWENFCLNRNFRFAYKR